MRNDQTNESQLAISILTREGHDVSFAHVPPPCFGTALRIWIDGYSIPVARLYELAAWALAARSNEELTNVLQALAQSS